MQPDELSTIMAALPPPSSRDESPTGDATGNSTTPSPASPSEIVDAPVTLSKEAQARIEVALYASGRPLSVEELAKVARVGSRRRLAELMSELARRINSTFTAIELKQLEGQQMFSLQLKPQYNSIAKKFATKPLLSTGVLRTLSYVVYLQPVSASELVQRRGSQAYSHVKNLMEVGFLQVERRGRSRIFRTTDSFADYFGLSHDPEQQRKQVAKQGLITKAKKVEGAEPPLVTSSEGGHQKPFNNHD